MTIKQISLILAFLFALSLSFCSSADKKEEPTTPSQPPQQSTDAGDKDSKAKANTRSMDLDPSEEFNEKLKDFRYPDGVKNPGFGYKQANIGKSDFSQWAKSNAGVIKEALSKLPPEYALEITGHSDSVGPENPEGKKKGNIFYSEERAIAVKNALVKEGVPAKKIRTKGAGSSNPVPGIDGADPKNRRVTFQIVKIEEDEKAKAPAPKKDEEKEKAPSSQKDEKKDEPSNK
ncbi:MAG: OmpA family protein [Leptospiraceae bacterium]|nr:OmpA family protein [Leptospiraceae bacterium]MCK6381668.1 OmpA family protein [Leptospiraceae bacterium]NUM40438.1 OmpA family protein [Leptospiraceae bacterium]